MPRECSRPFVAAGGSWFGSGVRKERVPVSPAIRCLRAAQAEFREHLYEYVERGGTHHSAQVLGVPEHQVIKTLVLEDDQKRPLIVLMHGDRQVSTRELARVMGARSVQPCTPDAAQKHTGYLVGGTSPFGTRRPLPIYAEETMFELHYLYINGGKRGLLVSMKPSELERVLSIQRVRVATS
jgi:Cys-tRNA(Pro) deacylase